MRHVARGRDSFVDGVTGVRRALGEGVTRQPVQIWRIMLRYALFRKGLFMGQP